MMMPIIVIISNHKSVVTTVKNYSVYFDDGL